MNFGEILATSLAMVRDVDGDQASRLELERLINQGNLEFVERTDYLRETVLMDLIDSQPVYDLPSVLRVTRVALGEEALEAVSYRDLDRRDTTWRNTTGTPCAYLRDLYGHDRLRVYPTPTKNGGSLQTAAIVHSQETGTIRSIKGVHYAFSQEPGIIRGISGYGTDDIMGTLRIDYTKYPAKLEADTDTPELPRQYHNCLAAYAAGHLLNRNREPDRAAPYLAEFEAQVSKAKGEVANTFQPSTTRRVRATNF